MSPQNAARARTEHMSDDLGAFHHAVKKHVSLKTMLQETKSTVPKLPFPTLSNGG